MNCLINVKDMRLAPRAANATQGARHRKDYARTIRRKLFAASVLTLSSGEASPRLLSRMRAPGTPMCSAISTHCVPVGQYEDLRHLSILRLPFLSWKLASKSKYSLLLPAENFECNDINYYHPRPNQPNLRQDVNQVFTFSCNKADAVDYRCKRQEG